MAHWSHGFGSVNGLNPRVIPAFAAMLLAGCGLAQAQPVITDMGVLPGMKFSRGMAITEDGSVVAGESGEYETLFVVRGVRWKEFGGFEDLDTPSSDSTYPRGISDDGEVIVGMTEKWNFPHGFLWTKNGGFVDVGTLPGMLFSDAVGVSGFGTIVAGSSSGPPGTHAFRWTLGQGMQDLGVIAGFNVSKSTAISHDGSTIVGDLYSTSALKYRGFHWTATSGMQPLPTLVGQSDSYARDVSGDGSVIVGTSGLNGVPGTARACRWQNGVVQELGVLPGGISSQATSVSTDGLVITGMTQIPNVGNKPFIWVQQMGMVDLRVYLESLNLDLTGWELKEVNGLSADGSAMTGQGTYEGANHGWVITGITYNYGCYADCDQSGVLGVDDFICFQTFFALGDPFTDCDGSGELGIDDFICFQTLFALGC